MDASVHFRRPFDWRRWNLHDYPRIVEVPCDLGTVMNNIEHKVGFMCCLEVERRQYDVAPFFIIMLGVTDMN